MRRTSQVFTLGVGVATLVAGLAPGTTAVAKPTSHAEALQQGNPAATAPSFDESADGAVYQGNPVSGKTIHEQELSCLAVDVGPSRCYDNPEALQAKEFGPPANASGRGRPHARASACGIWEILIIWNGKDFTGSSAGFADRHRWANLAAAFNNEGSSFTMGDHSGHLADGYDGLHWWYPGNTGACASENNLNTNGSGWNNRISSRYRN